MSQQKLLYSPCVSRLIGSDGMQNWDHISNYFSRKRKVIFTARKRSLRRLCFYTCLSVILFTGGVWSIACWDTHPHLPGPEAPPWIRHTPTPGTWHSPGSDTPPGPGTPCTQCMLADTGNKRAVYILLECNLLVI